MYKYIRHKFNIRLQLAIPPLRKKYRKREFDALYRLIKDTAPVVFVYQMGKVASTSVHESIREQYQGVVLHDHTFDHNSRYQPVRSLYRILQEEKVPLKVISLIREPIGRNISAFFENFERDSGVKYKNSKYTPVEVLNVFLTNFKHREPLDWFDENIKVNFGIDVYEKPFPKEGYTTYKNEEVELLLLRHDLNDNLKESLVKDFIDMKDFQLINRNIGSKKDYAEMYKKVLKLPFPKEYVDNMLNSKYTGHFYKEDEAKVRKKWLKLD
jgi:hypothetical protein